MKVLVVEDEADVAAAMAAALESSGYEPTIATNGNQAVKEIVTDQYDLVVLDIALPGIDGFEVLKQTRPKVKTPVMMLTARSGVKDRVKGLTEGADDYLTKPFELSEFLARVQALIRRNSVARGVIEVGDLWIDPVARKVRRMGRTIYFSNTEFALLEFLASKKGEVISKKEILTVVWENDEYRDPNLVEVYIGYLRQKLEVNRMPRMIHTVRGLGYCMVGD